MGKGLTARNDGRIRRGEIAHHANAAMRRRLARAKDGNGVGAHVARALHRGDNKRSAPVANKAAIEQVQRIADRARSHHILGGDGPLGVHHRHRIEQRPFARGGGDVAHLVFGGAIFMEMAQHRQRIGRGRTNRAERVFELPARILRRAHRRHVDPAFAALAVNDQRHIAQPGHDRSHGVTDHHDIGTAPHRGAVHIARRDIEVFGDLVGRGHRAENAVDFLERKPSISQCVARGLGMDRQTRMFGQLADAVRMGGAHNGGISAGAMRAHLGSSPDHFEHGQGYLVAHMAK